jgi:hypothetical protein
MWPNATSQATPVVGQHPGRTRSLEYLAGLYGVQHGTWSNGSHTRETELGGSCREKLFSDQTDCGAFGRGCVETQ